MIFQDTIPVAKPRLQSANVPSTATVQAPAGGTRRTAELTFFVIVEPLASMDIDVKFSVNEKSPFTFPGGAIDCSFGFKGVRGLTSLPCPPVILECSDTFDAFPVRVPIAVTAINQATKQSNTAIRAIRVSK
jgi:hypothetical protein